ncbi:uncharacterized protein LOC121384077 [Gigantopelta aegis]|uniref:uncharacterized protein LOC121384077 n=1 Tax=Gigantopelta aegis TaxID=1735272 RepID=UPI001B8886FB|nr:uncharacterized protein LOC121384077 [Gigantopelta aegis]
MSRRPKRSNKEYHSVEVENMTDEFDPDQTLNVDMTSALANIKQKGFQGAQRSVNHTRCSSATIASSKNRARPKKFFEMEAFLTIDSTPKNKQSYCMEMKTNTTPVYSEEYLPDVELINSDKLCKKQSSTSTHNFQSRPSLSHGASKSQSPTKMTSGPCTQYPSKINYHVKMPFKHCVYRTPSKQQVGVTTPSQGLKERTAFATQQVNKILAQQKHQPTKKIKGKLQVGKLKPLYPVHKEGPSMKYCRGIVADTRCYSASPSRTLQRQRRLICNINNMNITRRMTEPELRDTLHLMSPNFDENAHLLYSRSGSVTSQDDVYQIERPLSLISISPLSFDQDSSVPTPEMKTPAPSPKPIPGHPGEDEDQTRLSEDMNMKKQEETVTKKTVKPEVDDQAGMEDALTKASQELIGAVDDIQQKLFPSFEDTASREIEVVARAQTVNNSNAVSDYDEPGVPDPVKKKVDINRGGRAKEFIFITEEADESDKANTGSDVQRSTIAAESDISVKSGGRLESAESLDQRPRTSGSSVHRVSSSKSVRFVDEQDETVLSSGYPRKPQLKPARTSCKPYGLYGTARTHDGDDDKENIPRKTLCPSVHMEGKGAGIRSASSSTTIPESQTNQGNVDGLDQPFSDTGSQDMQGNVESLDQPASDKETSALLNMSKSAASATSEDGQVKVNNSETNSKESILSKVNNSETNSKESILAKVNNSETDSKESILSQIQRREMQPLVIELAESKLLDERTNSYSVSECSTVLGVLEKYPDLCKYLKVENISGRGAESPANSSEAAAVEMEQSGSHPAFKITFSTFEPDKTDRPSSAENKSLQDQSTTTEVSSKHLKKRRRRKVKVNDQVTKLNQACSSTSGIQHAYVASTRQNFPSDILDCRHGSSTKASDSNSVPVRRSSSPSCRVPLSSRRWRPSSACSSRSQPDSPSSTRIRPSSACPSKSSPSITSFRKSRPSSAPSIPSYANRRSSNPSATSNFTRLTPTSPTFLQKRRLQGQNTKVSDPGEKSTGETNATSFNELQNQIDIIQSELRRNIDENALLLSTTEQLRESLKTPSSPTSVDDADMSGNSDLDSAVCEETSTLIGSASNTGDFYLESDEDYENLLLSYRKMCMNISEGSVVNEQISTPKCKTPESTRAGKDNSGRFKLERKDEERKSASETSPKMLSEVIDSGCESEPVTEAVGVDHTGEVTDKEKMNLLEETCQTQPEHKMDSASITKNGCSSPELEVIATTKKLSKAKVKVKCLRPSAPFPPLCFSVNARPPPGCLYYFSYGTDMNINRISNYISRKVENQFWGLLFGFSLVFNKRGFDRESGGFPNIEFSPSSSVEGCVYQLTPKDVQVLDKCIGYPEHYEHVMIPVWMSNCRDPDVLGVAQYCVPALTYIAQDKWTEKGLQPCEFAVSQCLKSSDLLTPQYKEHLVKMSVSPQTVEASE